MRLEIEKINPIFEGYKICCMLVSIKFSYYCVLIFVLQKPCMEQSASNSDNSWSSIFVASKNNANTIIVFGYQNTAKPLFCLPSSLFHVQCGDVPKRALCVDGDSVSVAIM